MVSEGDIENKIRCPYCRALSEFDFYYHNTPYYHCLSCDLFVKRRYEDVKDVIAYYRDSYFDDSAEVQLSEHRIALFSQILNLLAHYKQPGSLLDLGCGCGFFLKMARDRGWRIAGVDPSRRAVECVKEIIGDAEVFRTLDDLPDDSRFDVIIMINVLDHMVDAFHQLKKVRDLLVPEGIIYLRLPNSTFHAFLVHLAGILRIRKFMDPLLIFHEYGFNARSIRRCLNDIGLTNIRVRNSHLTGGHLHFFGRKIDKPIGKIVGCLIYLGAAFTECLSGGRWIWGPSMQVIVRKGTEG